MAANFLSLPAELRNMIYGKYLFDDLTASEYFNNQVKLAQLHIPELARAYPPQPANTPASQQRPDIYDEVLTYFYSRMTATMNIRTALAFWNHWTLTTASDDFVAHLCKFEMTGRVVCNGYTHAKILIDLNDLTNPVSIGNDQPQVHQPGCGCIGRYRAAANAIDAIVWQGNPGGRLVLTTRKLREIFAVVAAI